jgi:hypothetical protein
VTRTRQLYILSLTLIAVTSIVGKVVLAWHGATGQESLLIIGAAAVGALATLAFASFQDARRDEPVYRITEWPQREQPIPPPTPPPPVPAPVPPPEEEATWPQRAAE